MNKTRTLLMSTLVAALAACDTSSTTATDDTPAAFDEKYAAARATESAAQPNLTDLVSDSDLVVGGADLEVPSAGAGLLAARAVLEPEVTETLTGNLWVKTYRSGAWTRVDSIEIVLADLATRDTPDIRATSVVSRLTGPSFLQRSILLDGNEDGYVLGNKNEEKIVELVVTKRVGNIQEVANLVAESGPDGDIFADDDNLVRSIDWVRTRGDDTVRSVSLFPLDGETYLSGDGKESRTYGATLHKKSLRATHDLDLVVRVRGTDTAIVGLSGRVKYLSGRVETISVKDQTGGSSVEVGDTAVFKVTVQAPIGDSVVNSSVTARILPGSGLGKADNRVILIEGRHEYRAGRFVVETFRLESAEGIKDGTTPTTGSFRWVVQLRDGGEASLVGTFTPNGVTGTWTAPDGTTKNF